MLAHDAQAVFEHSAVIFFVGRPISDFLMFEAGDGHAAISGWRETASLNLVHQEIGHRLSVDSNTRTSLTSPSAVITKPTEALAAVFISRIGRGSLGR